MWSLNSSADSKLNLNLNKKKKTLPVKREWQKSGSALSDQNWISHASVFHYNRLLCFKEKKTRRGIIQDRALLIPMTENKRKKVQGILIRKHIIRKKKKYKYKLKTLGSRVRAKTYPIAAFGSKWLTDTSKITRRFERDNWTNPFGNWNLTLRNLTIFFSSL